MPLSDLLNIQNKKEAEEAKTRLELIEANKETIRMYISFWRMYPDIFLEFLCKNENPENFSLYPYQRVFLRAAMRHKYLYATYPRAYSKSFLSVLALILKCILYPNSHYFVSSGGKDQAASILQEKSELLLKLIPALKREIRMNRGESKLSKDDFVLKFKNYSQLDVFAASERTRGKRATGGILEEVILIDGQILNDILIPRCWGVIA